MKRFAISTLLNALVFPGSGHLALKAYRRGLVFIALTLVCLAFAVTRIVALIGQLLPSLSDAESIDPAQLQRLLQQHLETSGDAGLTLPMLGLLLIWLVALIDGIRLNKRRADPPDSRVF